VARNPSASTRGVAFNQGRFPTVAFVNLAKTPLGVDLGKLVAALQKQMERDFVPVWGYPAKLYVTDKPKPEEWQVVFLDDADAANALGYHDLTKNGQPISKVFVKTTIAAGQKVSVTASHEFLEMMIDPGAQLWAQSTDGRFYAYEMCDAVEDEEYEIDGISVSDFVYPSFFESWHKPGSVQFDYLKKVSRPFQTLQNGYQIVSNGNSVKEIFGSMVKARNFFTLEVRTQHRSEYRKMLMQGGPSGPSSPGPADLSFKSPHTAMLYHAGQFLTALAAVSDSADPPRGYQVGPFGTPWQTDPRRGYQVDPFGTPWQTDPRRGYQVDPFGTPWQTDPRHGYQVGPFPTPYHTDPRRAAQVDPFPWPWQTDPPNG
jgi:hypothetical protein